MKLRHTLIYSNKTWEDVIFRRQLEELAAAVPRQADGRPRPLPRAERSACGPQRPPRPGLPKT